MSQSYFALGMELFSDNYQVIDDAACANAILVRSASMHDMELGENLDAIARAGRVLTIFLWKNVLRRHCCF